KFGTLIKIDEPKSKIKKAKAELCGMIEIYDAMGNKVFSSNSPEPSSSSSSVYFFWDGTNKNNRFVGKGTYLMIVKAWKKDDGKKTPFRFKIGVKTEK
ncbi:MAG TPA: gliding motility-associated C-terminal domain-containing protein, partial [Chitinispirillaceae bacterium]|nr:gliding motility-associated C-terminal domain-containing protein [Chitinispirillaceae bacterium]